MFEIEFNGDDELRRALNSIARTDLGPSLEKGGQLLLTGLRSNTNGRPGPLRQTGQLQGSFSVSRSGEQVSIGTNSPYARRLEFGFNGTDSLGRTYNQPPYPFMSRTVDSHGSQAVDIVFADLTRNLGR